MKVRLTREIVALSKKGERISGESRFSIEKIRGGYSISDGNFKIAEVYDDADGFAIKVFPSIFFGLNRFDSSVVLFTNGRVFLGVYSSMGNVEKHSENYYRIHSGSIKLSFSSSPHSILKVLLKIPHSPKFKTFDSLPNALRYLGRKVASGEGWYYPANLMGDDRFAPQVMRNLEEYGVAISPLFFRYRSREAFFILDEFLVSDLLICPDHLRAGGRGVWLPKGKWLHLNELTILEGGWYTVQGDGLFIRENGYYIMRENDHMTLVAFLKDRIKGKLTGRVGGRFEMEPGNLKITAGSGREEWLFRIFHGGRIYEISLSVEGEKEVRF